MVIVLKSIMYGMAMVCTGYNLAFLICALVTLQPFSFLLATRSEVNILNLGQKNVRKTGDVFSFWSFHHFYSKQVTNQDINHHGLEILLSSKVFNQIMRYIRTSIILLCKMTSLTVPGTLHTDGPCC